MIEDLFVKDSVSYVFRKKKLGLLFSGKDKYKRYSSEQPRKIIKNICPEIKVYLNEFSGLRKKIILYYFDFPEIDQKKYRKPKGIYQVKENKYLQMLQFYRYKVIKIENIDKKEQKKNCFMQNK